MQLAESKLNDIFDELDINEYSTKKTNKKSAENPIDKIIKIIRNSISNEWLNILNPPDDILRTIATIKVYPSYQDIFNFARFTPINKLKVIILGQDPYHKPNHAHGLAFSSQSNETPKSLLNIYKALIKSKLLESKPKTNNLTNWAVQGVLLLNTALTVLPNSPKSHIKLWDSYILELLFKIAKFASNPLVVILWGVEAQQYQHIFKNHIVLKYHHPSPLAGDFSDCPNFIECNNYLIQNNQTPINWNPDEKLWCEAYTDGSSFPNVTGPDVESGYSVIFTEGILAHLKLYGKTTCDHPHYSNNIRAEGTALLYALRKVETLPLEQRLLFHIITDCNFWIDMLKKFIPSWVQKGGIEKIDEYKNPDLVKEIWNIYNRLIFSGTNIVVSHVYSHDKKKGSKEPSESTEFKRYFFNGVADLLANNIRKKFQNGQYGEMMSEIPFEKKKF